LTRVACVPHIKAMNYRHGYHAGNFADVLKHAVFLACLDDLAASAAPFSVIDTHAGAGVYDLSGAEAQKTGEWCDGVGRLLNAEAPPPLIARYLDAVRAAQTPGFEGILLYPGSPRLALQVLRPSDHYTAVELLPASAALLQASMAGRQSVQVMAKDGYHVLSRLLEPGFRRGLVLIDPPFEAANEFERLGGAIKQAFDLWDSGVFVVWHPLKDVRAAQRFEAELIGHAIPNMLAMGLTVQRASERMTACGLIVINPPEGLHSALAEALPWLAARLAKGPGAEFRLDWLAGAA
jgi:23S rRNA (adenine2030-N6)-methyltransferase